MELQTEKEQNVISYSKNVRASQLKKSKISLEKNFKQFTYFPHYA